MLESGASLGGGATGAVIGAVIGGPPGAAIGAGAGWATEKLANVGFEIAQRYLAPRSEMRVGSVFVMAYEEISARLMRGDEPREDLRAEITPGRSRAEELVEATLVAAADTYEERKLPYLAHLLAAITFEPGITHAHANRLITVADQLSYRQLVELAAFIDMGPAAPGYGLRGEGSKHLAEADEVVSIRADLLDLFRRDLLQTAARSRRVRQEGQSNRISGIDFPVYADQELPWPAIPREVSPRDMRLSNEGQRLVRMMRLDLVPVDEREELVIAHLLPTPGE